MSYEEATRTNLFTARVLQPPLSARATNGAAAAKLPSMGASAMSECMVAAVMEVPSLEMGLRKVG